MTWRRFRNLTIGLSAESVFKWWRAHGRRQRVLDGDAAQRYFDSL